MSILRRLTFAVLPLGFPLVALATGPLTDETVATSEGWVRATPCVRTLDSGAMGAEQTLLPPAGTLMG